MDTAMESPRDRVRALATRLVMRTGDVAIAASGSDPKHYVVGIGLGERGSASDDLVAPAPRMHPSGEVFQVYLDRHEDVDRALEVVRRSLGDDAAFAEFLAAEIAEAGSTPATGTARIPGVPSVIAGDQIECAGADGTLGVFAEDSSGDVLLVSCAHVLAPAGLVIGAPVAQPAGGSIVAAVFAAVIGDPARTTGNTTDCATAKVNSGLTIQQAIGLMKRMPGAATLGTQVEKIGATTRRTWGRIGAIATTFRISYAAGGIVTYDDLIVVRPDRARNPRFSRPGDSGSVVLADGEGLGLLLAGLPNGSSLAMPLTTAAKDLHFTMFTDMVRTVP